MMLTFTAPKFISRFVFCLLIIVNSITASAQLNGLYTVNPAQPSSATNFQQIGEANTALMNNGINGPVTIQIFNGVYNQQIVSLGSVAGSSTTNTITFTSFSNDSLQVQINSTLTFTGTSNIIIRKLNLDRLIVDGNVTNYIITNNQVKTFSWMGGDDITFINNFIKPQNSFNNSTLPPPALSFGSKSGAFISNVVVQNNIFKDVQYRNNAGVGTVGVPNAVNWSKVRKPILKNNVFNTVNMTNIGYSLIGCCSYVPYPYGGTFQFDNCTDTAFIENNKFDNIHTDRLVHDINASNQQDGTPRLSKIVIRNNFFTVTDQLSTAPYAQGATTVQFYYNNVNNIGNGAGPYFQDNVTDMKNNIFSSTNGKKAFSYTFSHPANADYNNFYTSGSILVTNGSTNPATNYTTLAQYQAATGTNSTVKI